MICPHCHTENRSGAKFCDECGTRLVAENAPEETQADSKALEGLPNISASGFGMTTPERAFSYEPVDEFNDDEPVAQQEIADEIDDALPRLKAKIPSLTMKANRKPNTKIPTSKRQNPKKMPTNQKTAQMTTPLKTATTNPTMPLKQRLSRQAKRATWETP